MKKYSLLPFNFTRISGREVLVNELGDIIITESGTVRKIIYHTLDDKELYKTLVANFFISEEAIPSLLDIYASRLRAKKDFLDHRTALHIFVLTSAAIRTALIVRHPVRKNSVDIALCLTRQWKLL